MNRSLLLSLLFVLLVLGGFSPDAPSAETSAPKAPNILWINIDDQSPWYGSYGDKLAQTPNLDALADRGVLFERAYAPSPVCSTSRSAIITGSYSI